MPLRIPAAAAVALALLALPSAAAAASPPRGFYGVNWDMGVAGAPQQVQDAEWRRMKRAGVETVRATFNWSRAQPEAFGPIDFTETDGMVARAASNGLKLLPVVMYTPAWAATDSSLRSPPPSETSYYTDYLRALVARYGPRGTFWAERPGLPRRPLREWQIWNEPGLSGMWSAPNSAVGYGKLLCSSRRALRSADPGSTTVLAGIVNYAWYELENLYRKGKVRGCFDVAAVHPYTGKVSGVETFVKRFARVLRRHHDRRPIWVTEAGFSAAKGRTADSELASIQTTDRGMSKRLTALYKMLGSTRFSPPVTRTYWYTWASSYGGDRRVFDFSGLVRYDGTATHAKPSLDAYRRLATQRR
jgi:hypothetical protein